MTAFRFPRWILVALASSFLAICDAYAVSPQVKTQAPGYYRMMLGDFEITALNDGCFDLNTEEMLTNTTQARRRQLLADAFEGDTVSTSVNAYLINTGDRLILVDTGAAGLFGPTLGHLLANLLASGYRPEEVDEILLTHLHPDHIGGLMRDGMRTFPNATVHADQREVGFWLSTTARENAPVERRVFFDGAVASIGPYEEVGRFKTFAGATDLFPGIRAMPAPGHTPGHTIFAIESKGVKLVLWGDLMEIAAIQFIDPAVTILFDDDGPEAAAQRAAAYQDAAGGRYLVGVAHLPFPGLGHVRSHAPGYAWLPLPYDALR